jgi:hypothetical protein
LDVISIAVIQRCKANYHLKQWDDGAGYKFKDMLLQLGTIGRCLADSHVNGFGKHQCMMDHFADIGASRDEYFMYEKDNEGRHVDACIVGTGPSKHKKADVSTKFTPCLEKSYAPTASASCDNPTIGSVTEEVCEIPLMVWSGSSENNVPVGNVHKLEASGLEADRNALALQYFADAKKDVECALAGLEEYANDNLDVVLFSAEGDSLHQMFDCMVQGPYAKVNLWSPGIANELPVPNWARDTDGEGLSRKLDLPCYGSKLNKDTIPPFTCGGSTRKAIIKYFVRDYINTKDGVDDGGNQVQNLVRAKIIELQNAWSQPVDKFSCQVRAASHLLPV